ncbi:MAG: DUF3786 domain-containing protein [Caldilineaceae bacterium]|nr:DUF3786 domain-containing protein [Caldilineaceae bacterium]
MTTVYDRNPALQKPRGRAAWAESLVPILEELRDRLRQRPVQEIAQLAGVARQPEECMLMLQHLNGAFSLSWPELVVYAAGSHEPCGAELQGLVLYYLTMADGTPVTGHWVAFRDLPNGWLYNQAFQSYTGDVLVQAIGDDLDQLHRAARAAGGQPLDLGDISYAFVGLPRIPLAFVYWRGDEEFPAQAQVLFDAAAGNYLPIDGSAALGRRLISQILAEAASSSSTKEL